MPHTHAPTRWLWRLAAAALVVAAAAELYRARAEHARERAELRALYARLEPWLETIEVSAGACYRQCAAEQNALCDARVRAVLEDAAPPVSGGTGL